MSPEYRRILVEQLQADAQQKSAKEILELVQQYLEGKVVVATSFGLEDQVLLDLVQRHKLDIPVITLDTGRLFPETYETWEKTEQHYGVQITPYYPETEAIEELVSSQGINGYRQSIANRQACCRIRKMDPLARALSEPKAWICGLRQGQSITRSQLRPVEWDEQFNLIKINPLYDWSEEELWQYVKAYEVPYNPLHDQGYPSIGCAGCTRPISKIQSVRDGRWWWETPETKECGLHHRPRT